MISEAHSLERRRHSHVAEAPEWTLADLLRVLRKRRRWVLWGAGSCFALMLAYCLLATPRYKATAEVEIQKERTGTLGLGGAGPDDEGAATDTLDYTTTLQTQAEILQSNSLALRVIEESGLEKTEDFFQPKKTAVAVPAWVFFWRKPLEPLSVPLSRAPDRRYVALRIFSRHLKVSPMPGTRLIEVSYSDPDPQRAAEVVNRLLSALTDYGFEARYAATEQASKWLASELEDLKRNTEELQAKAVTLQRATGMFGDDESHNIVLARLESLNENLASAEANRILKEAIYRTAQAGDPELISGLSGNAGGGANSGLQNSLALIQNLRSQEAGVRAELAEDSSRYGPKYPHIAELQSRLKDTETSIEEEASRLRGRARTDYQIAADSESAARAALEDQKQVVNKLNDKAVAYALAKQEADGSRDLYESLLGKLKEVGILEGLRASEVTVVDAARVPPANHPSSPNLPLYMAGALAFGFCAGAAGAVVRELTDESIQDGYELEVLLETTLLGAIPLWISPRRFHSRFSRFPLIRPAKMAIQAAASEPRTVAEPHSEVGEAFRSLRTTLLLSRGGGSPKVILVTSALAGEGKSTVALNLAAVLGQQGSRVLLVEADMRCPTFRSQPGGDDVGFGLSEALADSLVDPHAHHFENLPEVEVVVSGPVPPFPAELLSSQRMRDLVLTWRSQYDFILLDSPPVLSVTDAVLLSQLADATLLVARYGVTPRAAISRAFTTLSRQMPTPAILGVVFNAVASESSDAAGYHTYKGAGYGAPHRS